MIKACMVCAITSKKRNLNNSDICNPRDVVFVMSLTIKSINIHGTMPSLPISTVSGLAKAAVNSRGIGTSQTFTTIAYCKRLISMILCEPRAFQDRLISRTTKIKVRKKTTTIQCIYVSFLEYLQSMTKLIGMVLAFCAIYSDYLSLFPMRIFKSPFRPASTI